MRSPLSFSLREWLAYTRPGDLLVVVLGTVVVLGLFAKFWSNARADRALVRQGGEMIAALDLNKAQRFEVAGPIGTTVIEISSSRARVVSDPGPRQICVQQGWLEKVNAVAICAPNQVSLTLAGPGSGSRHDSIAY
jgi:hypothetical protein